MEAIEAEADASPFERVSTRISRGPRRASAAKSRGTEDAAAVVLGCDAVLGVT
jgi:hypothetical protein